MVGGGVEHVDAELLHLGLLAHLADILVGGHSTVLLQFVPKKILLDQCV